jgi:hypothetical protein
LEVVEEEDLVEEMEAVVAPVIIKRVHLLLLVHKQYQFKLVAAELQLFRVA